MNINELEKLIKEIRGNSDKLRSRESLTTEQKTILNTITERIDYCLDVLIKNIGVGEEQAIVEEVKEFILTEVKDFSDKISKMPLDDTLIQFQENYKMLQKIIEQLSVQSQSIDSRSTFYIGPSSSQSSSGSPDTLNQIYSSPQYSDVIKSESLVDYSFIPKKQMLSDTLAVEAGTFDALKRDVEKLLVKINELLAQEPDNDYLISYKQNLEDKINNLEHRLKDIHGMMQHARPSPRTVIYGNSSRALDKQQLEEKAKVESEQKPELPKPKST